MDNIRILILEDNSADMELMEHELRRGDIRFTSKRVATKGSFERELEDFKPDIILADYSLPQFNAMEALLIMECKGIRVPFIIVTGTVKEEIAMKCVESGAWDYVIKDHLMRLSVSVKAALARQEAEKRRDVALDRLRRLNDTLLTMGDDFDANINTLVNVSGELMGATCVLYNRLERGMLCSVGKWNTPPGFNPVDMPDGHICYDVIQRHDDDVLVVTNLGHTKYATTDPNVSKYGLKTYMGKSVKRGTEKVGSVCAAYQRDFTPDENDERFLSIIASAISAEEERKLARDQAKEMAVRFETVLENTPMVAVQGFDKSGVIHFWNTASEKIYGFKASEAIGKRLQDLILRQAEADNFPKAIEELWRTHKPLEPREWEVKNSANEKLVTYSTVFPVMHGSEVLLAFCMDVDITERKKSEELLKENQQKFQTLFESAPDAYYITDITGNFIDGNEAAEKITGFKREELIGNSMFQAGLLPASQLAHALALLGRNALGKATGPDDFTLTRKDGSTVEVEISTHPVKIGKNSLVLGIARDITERKKADKKLKDMLEELKRYKEMTVGRENRMIELKKEVNKLSQELGRPVPYDISFAE